jgi:hypothetical protein
MSDLKHFPNDELERMIASGYGGQLGHELVHERQRRLLSGDATLAGLKSAVDHLVGTAPQDHDVLILVDDLYVLNVTFIEPHTFLFEGVNLDGHQAARVIHFSQVQVSVIYRPKLGTSRVITGFAPNTA